MTPIQIRQDLVKRAYDYPLARLSSDGAHSHLNSHVNNKTDIIGALRIHNANIRNPFIHQKRLHGLQWQHEE